MKRKTKSSKKITNDKIYHALGRKYPRLLLALANEIHGTSYTGEEKLVFGSDEHYQKEQKGGVKKRVSDTQLVVEAEDGTWQERLHFECQSKNDKRMSVRMAEYEIMIALENHLLEGNMCNLNLPRAAVVYLTGTLDTPEVLLIHIVSQNGDLQYKIPTLKAFNYTMKQLLERELFLLILFHVLVYKNRMASYNKNEEELEKLQKIYIDMVRYLEGVCRMDKLTQEEVTDILSVSAEIVDIVAEKYEKVRKVLGDILRGQVYELPTDRLIRQGRQEGRMEGALDMCIQLVKKGIVTLAQAAAQLGMTEEEFSAKMQ